MWVSGFRVFETSDNTTRRRQTMTIVGDSVAQDVYLLNPTAITGPIDVTIGGVAPDTDTMQDATGTELQVQTVKLRLGIAGRDEGLVGLTNPMPITDPDAFALLAEMLGELKVIRLILEAAIS